MQQLQMRKLISRLEWAEVDGSLAPDCRRMLRGKRMDLISALRSGDSVEIRRARDAVIQACEEWEIPL